MKIRSVSYLSVGIISVNAPLSITSVIATAGSMAVICFLIDPNSPVILFKSGFSVTGISLRFVRVKRKVVSFFHSNGYKNAQGAAGVTAACLI